jgi:hypothetical protein
MYREFSVYFSLVSLTILLTTTCGLIPGSSAYVRIQNVWQPNQYINIEKGPVEADGAPATFHSSHWVTERFRWSDGAVTTRFTNRWKPSLVLTFRDGYVVVASAGSDDRYSHWYVKQVSDSAYWIQNFVTEKFLHTEYGRLMIGDIGDNYRWDSAKWRLISV